MAHILLADDDAGMLDTVRRALELDGHTVTACDDGADALAKIKSGAAFDVLVADVQMPGLDGISLARQAMAASGLRAVLMSGHAAALDEAQTVAGVRVVAKPFPIDEIRSAVRAALKG